MGLIISFAEVCGAQYLSLQIGALPDIVRLPIDIVLVVLYREQR